MHHKFHKIGKHQTEELRSHWACMPRHLSQSIHEIRVLVTEMKVSFSHVLRQLNIEADKLSKWVGLPLIYQGIGFPEECLQLFYPFVICNLFFALALCLGWFLFNKAVITHKNKINN